MRPPFFQVLLGGAMLAACQSLPLSKATIAADGRIFEVAAGNRIPSALLRSAGIQFEAGDKLLNNGLSVTTGGAVPPSMSIHLEVIRPIPVLIDGEPVLTTAMTVGEALRERGLGLYAADAVEPPSETPITPGMLIAVRKAVRMSATADSVVLTWLTASGGLGTGLAEAGVPLEGMDNASTSESGVPHDGGDVQIKRLSEDVLLTHDQIPFESSITDSAELELGLERVLQPGIPGLAVSTTRVRREDGAEVSRATSTQIVAVEPQDRKVVRGTKLVETTQTVDGVTFTYWRNVQMYATVYSPCNSGTADGGCSSGTASGRPAGKGVVAVDPELYAYLNGQRVYIPGYGLAVIGDIGGGYIIEQTMGVSRYKWIDLGFDDNNIQDLTGWVSVYFLAPPPAVIPEVLR